VFDESVFPFAILHPNAGAQLRVEISLLSPYLHFPMIGGNDLRANVDANPANDVPAESIVQETYDFMPQNNSGAVFGWRYLFYSDNISIGISKQILLGSLVSGSCVSRRCVVGPHPHGITACPRASLIRARDGDACQSGAIGAHDARGDASFSPASGSSVAILSASLDSELPTGS
jgi:hypothetical protein